MKGKLTFPSFFLPTKFSNFTVNHLILFMFDFEHFKEPIATRRQFIFRSSKLFLLGFFIILISLGGGIWGYSYFEGYDIVDSFLNASMILGGMGPVKELQNNSAKIFAGFYALFSGIILIASISIMISPFVHRLLHKFHADPHDNTKDEYN